MTAMVGGFASRTSSRMGDEMPGSFDVKSVLAETLKIEDGTSLFNPKFDGIAVRPIQPARLKP